MAMSLGLVVQARSFGFGQSIGQRANVRGVAATAATDITDALGLRNFSELEKLVSRDLDGFQLVREGGLAREAMTFLGGAERGGLGGDGSVGCSAHFAQQRE